MHAMKRALITLVALAVGMTAFAQYGPGRPGGGRGYGPNYGGGGYRPSRYYMDGAFEVGIMFNHFNRNGNTYRPDRLGYFGEYRVKINPVVDMGLQLSTTFGKGSYTAASEPYGPDARFWQGTPLVVTDFNLFPYSGFNPYFGLGVGPTSAWASARDSATRRASSRTRANGPRRSCSAPAPASNCSNACASASTTSGT